MMSLTSNILAVADGKHRPMLGVWGPWPIVSQSFLTPTLLPSLTPTNFLRMENIDRQKKFEDRNPKEVDCIFSSNAHRLQIEATRSSLVPLHSYHGQTDLVRAHERCDHMHGSSAAFLIRTTSEYNSHPFKLVQSLFSFSCWINHLLYLLWVLWVNWKKVAQTSINPTKIVSSSRPATGGLTGVLKRGLMWGVHEWVQTDLNGRWVGTGWF